MLIRGTQMRRSEELRDGRCSNLDGQLNPLCRLAPTAPPCRLGPAASAPPGSCQMLAALSLPWQPLARRREQHYVSANALQICHGPA